jgi:hypothetical protein
MRVKWTDSRTTVLSARGTGSEPAGPPAHSEQTNGSHPRTSARRFIRLLPPIAVLVPADKIADNVFTLWGGGQVGQGVTYRFRLAEFRNPGNG